MNEEQWRAVWKLYQASVTIPEGDRRTFLGTITESPEIRDAVLKMLRSGDAPEVSDYAGQRIGHYLVTGRIGHGGMGEVYSARDTELARSVAIKFLRSLYLGTQSAIDRCTREAKAASALNHPNIVTIHEIIPVGADQAIVMELIDGVALRQICGAPQPVDQILHLGQQIARGLAAAHAKGIVHRDLKPENIMVRPDGVVKLLDFGVAFDLNATNPGSVFPAGTLRYMSPEQGRGLTMSGASDVFSLGIVLYEMATGVHPFDSLSLLEAVNAVNSRKPAAPSKLNEFIPPQLDELILAMLAKDAAGRPAAADVARALESRLRGDTLRSVLPPPAVPAMRGRKIMPATAVLAVLAAALVLWGPWSRTQPNPDRPLLHLDLDVGDEVSQFAISRDGMQIVALTGNHLVLRRLDQAEFKPIPGTEGASFPFFSPDGNGWRSSRRASCGKSPSAVVDQWRCATPSRDAAAVGARMATSSPVCAARVGCTGFRLREARPSR
jgi:serine/threonine protein kinase